MDKNLVRQTRSKMLIIDDDFINREILKNIFQGQFEFEEAENGLEGLRKIELYRERLAVVLTDVNMPVMDGMEMLNKIHDTDVMNQIPVFLITANDELAVAEEAYKLGVMGVITKPVVPFVAMRRVQLVVELFQTRDALNMRVNRQEKKIQEDVATIDALHRNTLEAMASAIEFRDVESGEHTNRIYGITKKILWDTEMGDDFSDDDIEDMAVGSIMHDVGKIAISDVILNKPGKLTKEEFETMKAHTVKGAELLERLCQMQTHPSYIYAMDIARHHHERWDGRGYPDGLKGDEISIWAQVVGIADVYDALVSPRVYKRAFSHDTAVEMIRNGECGQFSPRLLRCFLRVEPELRKMYTPTGGEKRGPAPVVETKREQGGSKELIDTLLLTAAVQSAYDLIISVNLTQNNYYMIDYDRFMTHCAQADGIFDDLIEAGIQSIPESHRQAFRDTFSREKLLEAYGEGKKTVSLDHPQYTDDGRLLDVSTMVLFMEDPRTGDIREITLARYRGEII